MPDPKTTKAKTADLGNRFAQLAAVPAEPEEETRPARQSRAAAVVRDNGPMPAEQEAPKETEWVRIPLNVDEEMRRALEQARLDDRIETTVRIRAMIQLWQEDERHRARVDKRARMLRDLLLRTRRPTRR